jgi:siroheme synthase (precorrin-2 oxidase/ferrochelatase)
MPNKVIRLTARPNEGFLVNAQRQRYPVIIADKKEKTGFYLGAFYDLDNWNLRYVYLKQ